MTITIKNKELGTEQELELTNEQLDALKKALGLMPNAIIGETVKIADIEWIVLNKDEEGNILCLAKDFVYSSTMFDSNTNNYATSSIRKKLNDEFLKKITKKIGKDAMLDVEIDLTSDDGLDDYGNVTDKVGLLTADMYRKYNRIIEKYPVKNWWWLATPWSTPHRGYNSIVRCVSDGGTLNDDSCSSGNGVRPFCIFSSSIFKSC